MRTTVLFSTLLLLTVASLLFSLASGSVAVSWQELLAIFTHADSGNGLVEQVVMELRWPRAAAAFTTGALLALAGGLMQVLLRNPLADPYLIGAASGAGLGAVAALSVNWPATPFGYLTVPLAAFIGALLTVLLVYQLAKVGKTLPVTNLILAGVAMSSFTTALTSFLMINASGELRRALVWLLGGSNLAGWKPVLGQLPYATAGSGALLAMSYRLNVLQFGDEQAQQLGVDASRSRTLVVIAATLATASAVAFSGIIGFVGLIVPHIMRRAIGGDMRRLLPLSLIGGAVFLLAADILARVLMAPQELPVGIITALCGAPFFLVILRRTKKGLW